MLFPLIETIAKRLNQFSIDYMIIGGQAVLVYGEARLTKDIDITLGLGPEELDRVLACLEGTGFETLTKEAEKFVHDHKVLPLRDNNTGLRIDLIFSISPYEREALTRTRSILIGKTMVRFVSPEDLVIHKMISPRARDWEDAKGVLLKNPVLDREYIRRWLREFDQALTTDYLDTFTKLEERLK